VSRVNAAADTEATVVRISMDAKAKVWVGDFSRAGKKRVPVKAADHDFKPSATVTPVGILVPQFDELFLACVTSKVTSDCLVDVLELWWQSVRERFEHVRRLVINLDNGPENHSHRTQFLNRLVTFAQTSQLAIQLAYYPPYHSKYNPVERCWGILENHWNGDVLDTVETVVKFAQTMTWKGKHPVVRLISTTYHTGVRLSKQAMAEVETHLKRLAGLEKWFVDISFATPVALDT
jgi:Rhodopirellula transposase DDE domain